MTSPHLLLQKKVETSIFLSCAFCCVREFRHVISNVHFEFQAEPNCELISRICVCEIKQIYILWHIYMYFFGLMMYHLCLCVPLCGVEISCCFKNGENCLGLRELL